MIIACSAHIAKIPLLNTLLSATVQPVPRWSKTLKVDAVAGWGAKPSGRWAETLAQRLNCTCLRLEDGFLRSYGTGKTFPPLALIVDAQGIYYDSTRPSALETQLQTSGNVLAGIDGDVHRAIELLRQHRLSKYNHAPLADPDGFAQPATQRVLVIDQTYGDISIALGAASAATFPAMLAAAREENPEALIYIKTHPEVSAGDKGGYLTDIQDDERTVMIRAAANPWSLIEHMDRVYVVTSQMGFEAALAGKPVSVFGLPWYAGWGVTDDRQTCVRRSRQRDVTELFAAAYFHYCRYLNPFTHQLGTIFNVIDWLVHQRQIVQRLPHRFIAVGLQRWKRKQLAPILAMAPQGVRCVARPTAAARLHPQAGVGLAHWGRESPKALKALAHRSGAQIWHLEDGFYRSVGLGSDLLIPPQSVVLDAQGLYFDPRTPSDLEQQLNHSVFDQATLQHAQQVRRLIIQHGVTKYNLEPHTTVSWLHQGKTIVLVPGQVEDDASIIHGCESVRTNLGVLQAVRAACPEAFIVYKPHPDVASGNRKGRVSDTQARAYADHVETAASLISCIDAADSVYTMTSMAGFEALLRNKSVVVFGRPFYAGWGLTQDQLTLPRRTRKLSLDELVAGVLLHYPLYWDWTLQGFTTCEAVLTRLAKQRDALAATGQLARLKSGWLRRQGRKLKALMET